MTVFKPINHTFFYYSLLNFINNESCPLVYLYLNNTTMTSLLFISLLSLNNSNKLLFFLNIIIIYLNTLH